MTEDKKVLTINLIAIVCYILAGLVWGIFIGWLIWGRQPAPAKILTPTPTQITAQVSYQAYQELQKRFDTLQADYNKLKAEKAPPVIPSVPKTEYDALLKERNVLQAELANIRNQSSQIGQLQEQLTDIRKKYADLLHQVQSENSTGGD